MAGEGDAVRESDPASSCVTSTESTEGIVAVISNQDIRRLQILVQDLFGVHIAEGITYLRHDLVVHLPRMPAFREHLVERPAVDPLHFNTRTEHGMILPLVIFADMRMGNPTNQVHRSSKMENKLICRTGEIDLSLRK